jgi:hypothetical protein
LRFLSRSLLLVVLSLVACDADEPAAGADAGTCSVDVPDACAQPSPTFTNDVLPILTARCNSCHVADSGIWPLDNYQHVVDWQSALVNDLLNCTMPPADAGTLPAEERDTILNWVACGSLQ